SARLGMPPLLQLWDESVQAVDARDWEGALSILGKINTPTSRTLFNTASAHLALGQLDQNVLFVIDYFLSVLCNSPSRLEEALSDCIWAQQYMRGNTVIDYRQLGLRFKLYSWQVLYNAAAVYSRMGDWEQAQDVLMSASQQRTGGRGGNIEAALDSVTKRVVLDPLLVPEGEVFRPRKQDVEQLKQRDFLGKAKVEYPLDDSKSCFTEPSYVLLFQRIPSGIPLPPGLKPPTRPKAGPSPAAPPGGDLPSPPLIILQVEDPLANRNILYQMVALYDYNAQGPEDLEFSEGDTIDILGQVNEEWLEGHCAGNIGIFPSCFAYRENNNITQS
uniref:NADPH oxidase activator 1-like n=1 Tax=Echeneis naucrates TaxID=173247 RepID=A0A665WGW1_ECHNA